MRGYRDNRTMARVSEDMKQDRELNGTAAEYVVSKILGLPWTGRGGDPHDPRADVGRDIEVRWSDRHGLILKALWGRRPIGPHVLVSGRNPYFILGWYPVSIEDYDRSPDWSLPDPAIVIPRSDLYPIETLRCALGAA